jgi:transposase
MPMSFCFYPNHSYGCEHVGHCPHLGGAALGTLVLCASDNDEHLRMLHGQLDFERERWSKVCEENQRLVQRVEQLEMELKLERQNKFATNQQKNQQDEQRTDHDEAPPDSAPQPKKRGAPVGHPGWFRPTPTSYDRLVEVDAPSRCPFCDSDAVSVYGSQEPTDHLQEDIIEGRYHVTLFRHPLARCRSCRRWVKKCGEGEILGSRIGPQLRATAVYLRNEIGISYRKVPRAIEDMFQFRFTPASLIAFEKLLAEQAEPIVDDIAKKLGSSDGAVHADETYWTLDGQRAYYWIHGTEKYIHFRFDTSRAGEVSRNVLGEHFSGTLVTDCYSGYEAHVAGAKQKCLAHLARTARDWQKLVPRESRAFTFFEDVKQWVKRGCKLHRQRPERTSIELAEEAARLRTELQRLLTCEVDHEKAVTLQARLKKHDGCWLVFLDDPRVPPTNNLAERALRPLVIMRKLTFGHRSEAGAQRMAKLMSVKETGKCHGRNPLEICYRLYTRPPDRVIGYVYGGR